MLGGAGSASRLNWPHNRGNSLQGTLLDVNFELFTLSVNVSQPLVGSRDCCTWYFLVVLSPPIISHTYVLIRTQMKTWEEFSSRALELSVQLFLLQYCVFRILATLASWTPNSVSTTEGRPQTSVLFPPCALG